MKAALAYGVLLAASFTPAWAQQCFPPEIAVPGLEKQGYALEQTGDDHEGDAWLLFLKPDGDWLLAYTRRQGSEVCIFTKGKNWERHARPLGRAG